ncbi:MAG TPA: hypothetical protein VIQ62_13265, partial [Burkholderiales bacterium]
MTAQSIFSAMAWNEESALRPGKIDSIEQRSFSGARYDCRMINSPHSTIAPTAWDPEFCARSPMFGPLAGWAARLR